MEVLTRVALTADGFGNLVKSANVSNLDMFQKEIQLNAGKPLLNCIFLYIDTYGLSRADLCGGFDFC